MKPGAIVTRDQLPGQLISSQRYLDGDKVLDKARRFSVFIVKVFPVHLRGVDYTLVIDGHHNYAAAMLKGLEPQFRLASPNWQRQARRYSSEELVRHFINNLSDSEIYDIETGDIIEALRQPEWR